MTQKKKLENELKTKKTQLGTDQKQANTTPTHIKTFYERSKDVTSLINEVPQNKSSSKTPTVLKSDKKKSHTDLLFLLKDNEGPFPLWLLTYGPQK